MMRRLLASISAFALAITPAIGADVTTLTTITSLTPTNVVHDGSLLIGGRYKITAVGTSNFVQAGALTNTVGTWFVATATGSNTPGTGTVTTGVLTVSGELLVSNIYNDPNAPPGIRSNYTQRGTFSGAASFHQISCVYGGVGYNVQYGTGTTCFNVSMAPTAIVLDGKFIIGQTYKITALGTTVWANVGYSGTPVVGGTFVATAAASGNPAGTGQAAAPFWTYAGKEFNILTAGTVIGVGNPGASDSDIVENTGGITINDTTEGVVSSGFFVIGNWYTIVSLGSTPTNFVSIGASANQLGVVFQATGVGDPTTNGQAKATGSHGYGGFFTINSSALGEFPIGSGVKVEEALSCLNLNCAQVPYLIGASVQRNGDIDVSGHTISAGAYTVGDVYTIDAINNGIGGANTDFTLIGSVDNNAGTSFVATGPGTGTGTADEYSTSAAFSTSTAGGGGAYQGYHYGLLLAQHIPHVSGGALPQPLAFDASLVGFDDPTPCYPNEVFTVGAINTGHIVSGGSGYGPTARYPAVHGGVFLTGGTGTYAIAIVNVTNGVITGVQLEGQPIAHGVRYTAGDILSADPSNFSGDSGSGFTWMVDTILQPPGGCPASIANWFNLPNLNITGYLFNSPHYQMTGLGDAVQTSVTLTGLTQATSATPAPGNYLLSGVVVANTANLCGTTAQWCSKSIVGVGLVDGTNPTVATAAYAPLYHQ